MGGAVFPLCWPVFGRGNVGNGNLLQKDLCQHTTPMTVVFSAPDPRQAIVNPHLRQRLLDTHKHVWLSLLWSHFSFLLDPGMHEVCALRESISPVLWKFCNQIPLAFKVKFPESSVCLPDPQVGKSAVGPWTFATVQELHWYNCSPVCGIRSHHFMANRWGNNRNSGRFYLSWAPKSLQVVTAAMKLKDACSLDEKLWQT